MQLIDCTKNLEMGCPLNDVDLRRTFFGVCLPVRIALAFALYVINTEAVECGTDCIGGHLVLRWLTFGAAAVIVVSFIYQDTRRKNRGFFGGKIWWNNWRKVNILNYFAAAMFLLFNKYGSHYFLFADVALTFAYAVLRRVFIFYV